MGQNVLPSCGSPPNWKQALLGLWEPWGHSEFRWPLLTTPTWPRASSPWLSCALQLQHPNIQLPPRRPQALGWGGGCCQVSGWGEVTLPPLQAQLWDRVFQAGYFPWRTGLQGCSHQDRGLGALRGPGKHGMGVPIALTPLPAPDAGCPSLSLAPLLLALGYPALPTGVMRPAAPTRPRQACGWSRRVNEDTAGTPSLGFGSCPRLTVEIIVLLQSVRPLGPPHPSPAEGVGGLGHPEAGCPPTLRPHFPGACPSSNHNILWGLARRAGRMTPK